MATQSEALANAADDADEQRVKRLFIGFLSSALGVEDQPLLSDDASARGQVGAFTIANPDGSYSVQGRAVSNVQQGSALSLSFSPGLLLLAGAAFWLLRK